MRDRSLLKVKVQAIPRGGQRLLLDLCVHLQLVWESGNFTPFLGPALRILEKQGPFDHRYTKRKNLTHLQSILFFKDSSAIRRPATFTGVMQPELCLVFLFTIEGV